MGDNHYKLFPDTDTNKTLFGDLGNATDMILFQPGTDVSPGSDASQAGNLLNLFLRSSPAADADWNRSAVGAIGNFIDCGMENECFVDPIITSFLGCYLVDFPRRAPCRDELNSLLDDVGNSASKIGDCLSIGGGTNETQLSQDELAALPDEEKLALCLLDAVLPSGLVEDMIKYVQDTVEKISDVTMVVVNILDVLEKGLPGEFILFVFGWAEFQDGELVAPYKWWYCLFAVSMFVCGLELVKLFATRFIIWTNR